MCIDEEEHTQFVNFIVFSKQVRFFSMCLKGVENDPHSSNTTFVLLYKGVDYKGKLCVHLYTCSFTTFLSHQTFICAGTRAARL